MTATIILGLIVYAMVIRILAGVAGFNDLDAPQAPAPRRRGLLHPLRVLIQRARYHIARQDYVWCSDPTLYDRKARALIREHMRLRSLLDERTPDDIARQVARRAKRTLLETAR